MATTFHFELLKRITSDLAEYRVNNVDPLRFPPVGESFLHKLSNNASIFIHDALAKLGWRRDNHYHKALMMNNLAELEPHLAGLEWLYHRLADDVSRRTLVEVMAYRVLSRRHTRLSRCNDHFWQGVRDVQGRAVATRRVATMELLDGWLDDFDLTPLGQDIRLRAHKLNVLNTFLLEQYRFNEVGAPIVAADPGDVVLDGGGCWGDTTLYFANRVGADGAVHVFEFSPANLLVMRQNLDRNALLKPRIHIHEEALWNCSGEKLYFGEAGPATTLSSESRGSLSARTRHIDGWAAADGGRHVDYIKLDVEGAEGRVLEGARLTIQTQKPKLAVALYHSLEDFVDLPRQIDQMLPEYRFHLGHYTIHEEETILFATRD